MSTSPNNTIDTKATRFWRNFFSFFLSLLIFVLSIACCEKIVFLSEKNISDIFKNDDYSVAYCEDIRSFASDACSEAGIPDDSVVSILDNATLRELLYAYSEGNFTKSEQYSESTYQIKIDSIKKDIISETKDMIKSYHIVVNDAQAADGVEKFADKITDYITEQTEFKYADHLKKITNLGNIAAVVMIIVLVILTLITGLITFTSGDKKYRGLRAIAYSVFTASALDLLMVAAYEVVNATKDLYIFPVYLCRSVMAYINTCAYSVLCSGIILFIAALLITAFVWKLKRDRK